MIFRQEVIEQFHCKLLPSLEIAKAEAIVVEPIKRKTSDIIVSNRDFTKEKLFWV